MENHIHFIAVWIADIFCHFRYGLSADSKILFSFGYYSTKRSFPRHAPKWFQTPLALQDTGILHSSWLGNF